jgi:hypothetical protein
MNQNFALGDFNPVVEAMDVRNEYNSHRTFRFAFVNGEPVPTMPVHGRLLVNLAITAGLIGVEVQHLGMLCPATSDAIAGDLPTPSSPRSACFFLSGPIHQSLFSKVLTAKILGGEFLPNARASAALSSM